MEPSISTKDADNSLTRVLGIDYGTKRIGVAVSDPLNIIARPVGTYPNDATTLPRISEIARLYNVHLVIVGMPLTLRGERLHAARKVEEFVETLQKTLRLEVKTVDERFTSTMAHQTLRAMGTTKKHRRKKQVIDEMAAALILQGFLDAGR